jgi:predicted AAA+ superfamily ATPase
MGEFINKLRLANNGYVAGQFLLTGISKIDSQPYIPQNLTGQVKSLTLLPLAAAEIVDNGDINFIYDLFIKKFHNRQFKNTINIVEIIRQSTFTEITSYKNYLDRFLKDIQFLANIENIEQFKQVIMRIPQKIGQSLDLEKFAKELEIDIEICKEYIEILNDFYLIITIDFLEDQTSHKTYMLDSNLLLTLLNTDSMSDIIFKNFVASELSKHIEYLDKYPYKLLTSKKVEFVIQNMQNNTMVGIDLKHDHVVVEEDFTGLKELQKSSGTNFVKGVILYLGTDTISFGDNLFAKPISALWGGN